MSQINLFADYTEIGELLSSIRNPIINLEAAYEDRY